MAIKWKKRIICLLLVLAVGLVPAFAQGSLITAHAAKEPSTSDWKETHKKIAETGKFNLYVNEKDLVVPGELLAEDDYYPGRGTFEEDGKICSKLLGLVSLRNKKISVIPLKSKYLPKKGDVVIGKIDDVRFSMWGVDINSPYSGILPASEVLLSNETDAPPTVTDAIAPSRSSDDNSKSPALYLTDRTSPQTISTAMFIRPSGISDTLQSFFILFSIFYPIVTNGQNEGKLFIQEHLLLDFDIAIRLLLLVKWSSYLVVSLMSSDLS